MKKLLIISCFVLLANNESKTDRRGFFKKLRDNYVAGRLEAAATKEEKRIIERKENEKMRRRMVFEKHRGKLVDGISSRLKHRRSTVMTIIIGGVALVVWLCHKGSLHCYHRERDRKQSFDLEGEEGLVDPQETIPYGIKIHNDGRMFNVDATEEQ